LNLFVISTGRTRRARATQRRNQGTQHPHTLGIQHRAHRRLPHRSQHIGRPSPDRARTAIRQLHNKMHNPVETPKTRRRKQFTEQRMSLRYHPHRTRQRRTKMLQSLAITPGTGKTHLAIGLAIRACQAGHRVLFATAADWVALLADAHHAGKLQQELVRLGRYPLLVIDEVGYIPFEPAAANLFFQLVSSRYERASLIVTSNKQFGRWGEVFGDDVVAAAMIDRLVHHAEVIALKGDSYRLKDRDLGRVPAASTTDD